MSGNVLAHAAFTSGKAGMTTTARHRLREYDAALAAGQPDENVTAVADLARRHVELGLGLVGNPTHCTTWTRSATSHPRRPCSSCACSCCTAPHRPSSGARR